VFDSMMLDASTAHALLERAVRVALAVPGVAGARVWNAQRGQIQLYMPRHPLSRDEIEEILGCYEKRLRWHRVAKHIQLITWSRGFLYGPRFLVVQLGDAVLRQEAGGGGGGGFTGSGGMPSGGGR